MSTDVAKRPTMEDTMGEIQRVADNTSIAKLHDLPQTTRALRLMDGLRQLRKLFDGEILQGIKELMDSNLGFRTDRAPGTKDKAGNQVTPYPDKVIKDCIIEGMLRGANIIGNEINIISARMYLTKEFYERVVRELVSDLRVTEGVPQICGNSGALVPMRASWIFEGRKDSIDCVKTDNEDLRIPVRVNAGMGTDAIIGKAYRKLYAKIHRRVTGSTWLEEETRDAAVEIPPSDYTIHEEPQDDAQDAADDAETQEPTEEQTSHQEAREEARQHPAFDGIESLLKGMQQITDIDEFERATLTAMNNDHDRASLQEWCEWRREEIRQTRGTRSNGK